MLKDPGLDSRLAASESGPLESPLVKLANCRNYGSRMRQPGTPGAGFCDGLGVHFVCSQCATRFNEVSAC